MYLKAEEFVSDTYAFDPIVPSAGTTEAGDGDH